METTTITIIIVIVVTIITVIVTISTVIISIIIVIITIDKERVAASFAVRLLSTDIRMPAKITYDNWT